MVVKGSTTLSIRHSIAAALALCWIRKTKAMSAARNSSNLLRKHLNVYEEWSLVESRIGYFISFGEISLRSKKGDKIKGFVREKSHAKS